MEEIDDMDEQVLDANDFATLGQREDSSEYFARPPIDGSNLENSDFMFMQIDCDYYIIKENTGQSPVIRMFGVTENGHSVLVHVHQFEPYFYVQMPAGFARDQENLELFRKELNVINLNLLLF